MRQDVLRPGLLVDINDLPLDLIEDLPDGGLRIGALARMSDVARAPGVIERFPAISQALVLGASAQLRKMASMGGNLCQRVRPVSTITRRPLRLLAGNSLVIGLGTLTYLVLRDLVHWAPDAISAACVCVVGAVLVVAMHFDGWPAALLRPGPGRALTLALTALALNRALAAYADGVHWTRVTPTTGSPPQRSASPEPASSCTPASGSAGHSPRRQRTTHERFARYTRRLLAARAGGL